MKVDTDRVMNKIAYIREQTTEIKHLISTLKKEEILKNPWYIKGLKFSLHTSIEAMIDIVYHICAKQFNKAPIDARDGLNTLVKYNILNYKDFYTYSQMIGLRNRIVHDYDTISDNIIYDISKNDLKDFDMFIQDILKFIQH